MVRKRAASLAMVLCLVTILTFLAAAMTSLFLFNVNFAQCSFNGETALTQAESGLQEVLYRLSQDPDVELGRQAKEDFTGTVASNFGLSDSYYKVTFDPSQGFPYSTNNVKGDRKSGYLGRAIPDGCIHIFSTGFCRGQYRTIEAVVVKPACPFGVACSGKLRSKTPISVVGTANASDYIAGKTERPGHIACNSPEGVIIEKGTDPKVTTKITGFIKSTGPIKVEQPAEVWGGLRAYSSVTEFPKFDLVKLDPSFQSLEGVVEIVEKEHTAQDLDVIYRCDHDLRFNGQVRLHEAYLYVKGNLVITGGLRGVGAVVVDGDVTVEGGMQLDGTNQVALIASGAITLKGGGNYFQGYLYSGKRIDAENVTVVGSLIVNSGNPTEGGVELDNVNVVNNNDAGKLVYTARSYKSQKYEVPSGVVSNFLRQKWGVGGDPANMDPVMRAAYEEQRKVFLETGVLPPLPPGYQPTGIPPNDPQRVEKMRYMLMGGHMSDGASVEQTAAGLALNGPSDMFSSLPFPGGAPSFTDLNTARDSIVAAVQALADARAIGPTNPDYPIKDAIVAAAEAALASAVTAYQNAATEYAQRYFAFVDSHPDGNGGSRLRDDAPNPDTSHLFEMDLNHYLPSGDRLQTTYWHVSARRL